MPTRAGPTISQSGKVPPQTDPLFPSPSAALLAHFPQQPPPRPPFIAAPDALHPPASQARCPGQGAANSSSSAPRRAAAMAPKEGRAAEPAAARPPSCGDSAAPWQREGAGSAAGGAAASRGKRTGERTQAAGATGGPCGRSRTPAGPYVPLLTVAIAQPKAGSTKTDQTSLPLIISPNSARTTSSLRHFV